MKVTKSRLREIIKEELLRETIGAPEGHQDDSYSFHDPDNVHVRRRDDMYDAGPEGPEMHSFDAPSTPEEITIVGVDGDGDTFARKTSLEDIKGMTSMAEVLEYLQDELRIPVHGLSSKSVQELKAAIEQNDSTSGY